MMKGPRLTIDTNVFLRSADKSSSDHEAAKDVFLSIADTKIEVIISPQIMHECWVVLTRSREMNGFGLTTDQAHEFVSELSRFYKIRTESKRCLTAWLSLVKEHAIKGVKAHDAHLAAWMINNDIKEIITFNTSDFASFPITVIHPQNVKN